MGIRLNLNLNDIKDGFELIPAGKYRAKVAAVEEKDSSSGNPMLVWTWKIMEGDAKDKEIKSFTSLQEQALFGLKQHLTAFGASGQLTDFDPCRLVGRVALLTIGVAKATNKNTGEPMEVNRINLISPAPAAPAGGVPGAAPAPSSQSDIPF
jgi:hypothetical protein